MNFLNLQYFVMAADEGNITRAAEKLNISQQSLSNHIANLEKTFQVELFVRKPSLTLTYAGERLYSHAVRILDIQSQIENEMKDISKHKNGVLRIGISYTRGRTFLPEIVPMFKERNPFVKLTIIESNSQALEEDLLRGHIDLYIGTNIPERPEFTAKRLTQDKFYLVVPKNIMSRVYGEKEAIYAEKFCHEVALEDFASQPFVLLSRENRIRNIVENYLNAHNIQLDIQLEMENIETLFALACRGDHRLSGDFFKEQCDCPLSGLGSGLFLPAERALWRKYTFHRLQQPALSDGGGQGIYQAGGGCLWITCIILSSFIQTNPCICLHNRNMERHIHKHWSGGLNIERGNIKRKRKSAKTDSGHRGKYLCDEQRIAGGPLF